MDRSSERASALEYCVGTHFDALTRRGGGILIGDLKGGVGGAVGPAVLPAVPALDQQHLVPLHARCPVPALGGGVRDEIDFSDPVGEKDSPYLFGTTVNLSESGMMIESKSKLKVGSEVNLSFFLTTSKENLNIKGKIVRSHHEGFGGAIGYGIIFQEMTESDRKNIIGLIQKQTYGQSRESETFFAGTD